MAKKPTHDLPDEDETPRRRRPHADQELPDAPEVDPQRVPLLPILISPPDLPDGPPPARPEPTPLVGVVHFENAAGLPNGSAQYPVPVTLRERVLIWRHQRHEQNHVNADGEWVYRLSHDAGVGLVQQDADLEPIEDADA